MDEPQFDALAKSFIHPSETRRRILASGLTGAVLGGFSLLDTEGKGKRKKKKKKKKTVPVPPVSPPPSPPAQPPVVPVSPPPPGPSRIVVRHVNAQGQLLPGGDYRVHYYDPVNGTNGVGDEVDMPDIYDIDDGVRDGITTIFIDPGVYVVNEAGSDGCPITSYAQPPGVIANVRAGERVDITIGDYPQGVVVATVVDGLGNLLPGCYVNIRSVEPLPLVRNGISTASSRDGQDCEDNLVDGVVRLVGLIVGESNPYVYTSSSWQPTYDPPINIIAGQTTHVTLHACPDGVAGCINEVEFFNEVHCGEACDALRSR